MPDADARSRRGTWVVLALILIGCVAGAVAVTYWRAVAQRTREASADPRDARRRDAELQKLEDRFAQSVQLDGDSGAMLDEARAFVARYPDFPHGRTLLGKLLLRDKQAEAGYAELEASLRLEPQQSAVASLAGMVAHDERVRLEQAGQHDAARPWSDRALAHFARAAELEPGNLLYRLHVAQEHFDRGELDEAQMLLLEITRADSSYHPAYALLSDVFARQNKIVPALTQVDHALRNLSLGEVEQRGKYVRKKAALLRRDNRPEEAYQLLATLTETQKMDPEVVDEMALSWQMLRRPERAAEEYERALARSPRDWRLASKAAEWRLRAGDREAARAHVRTLRQINPRLDVVAKLEAQLQ